MASGRLTEETKNDNSNLLGAWPNQGKVGMEGGRRHGVFSEKRRDREAGEAKGPHVKTPTWDRGGAPRVPRFLSRSRSGVGGGDPASMLFGTRRGHC